ncbi:hypothetical protein [Streptomyces sp. NPDC054804]
MPSPEAPLRRRLTVGTVLGGAAFTVLLAFLNFVTGVYTWLAFAPPRAFPLDNLVAGYIACLLAPLTALITLVPVGRRWLSIWFPAPPAAFLVTAAGRLVYVLAG